MISPTNDRSLPGGCRTIRHLGFAHRLANGAVRGEPIIQSNRVVGYRKHLVMPVKRVSQSQDSSGDGNLLSLTPVERQSIESACSTAKYVEGPAAYNRCLDRQLEAWAAGPRQPDLSRLTPAERQSIESACSTAKYVEGPAAYNRCLEKQLVALRSYYPH
jgi:hypothetical protein